MSETPPCAAAVALELPIRREFSYLIPENMRSLAVPGRRVEVPFGPRRMRGFIVAIETPQDATVLKSISQCIENIPPISPQLLDLGRKIAARYFAGLGEVLAAFLPAGVKTGASTVELILYKLNTGTESQIEPLRSAKKFAKQVLIFDYLKSKPEGASRPEILAATKLTDSPLDALVRREIVAKLKTRRDSDVFSRLDLTPTHAPVLNDEQSHALARIREGLNQKSSRLYLLEGVTGSGKTEVYLAALDHCLAQNRSAIVLVPEISLTPQTVERFQARFGRVAVLHSQLSDADRAAQWEELQAGRARIAIGPRSAVFAPVQNLGLIILDEEHESTFKQQNTPRYHARDVAALRCRIENAVLVLGSATPSLEAWYAASAGACERIQLTRRATPRPLPPVTLVDMRSEKPIGPAGLLSPVLTGLIGRGLDRGEQSLLFLNRRGYNTTVLCSHCGFVLECPNCSVPLVFYRQARRLICHYCSASAAAPTQCPECRHLGIRFSGFGTETVEHAVKTLFPKARVARVDRESMQAKHSYEEVFGRVRRGELDVLIGTQMIAKGHDFPGITLIGVISAETTLLIPDFRSAERTFQLLTQVAGRAGRGSEPGRVIVQTFMPDHYSLTYAAAHDYEGFARHEIEFRKAMSYPPFGFLARLVVQGSDEQAVLDRVKEIAGLLRPKIEAAGLSLLGPAPAPIAMIQGKHRHHLVLKSARRELITSILEAVPEVLKPWKTVQTLVDIDPTTMM